MNKFDDIMGRLLRTSVGFMQIVAVDCDFRILQRIWCIAELVEVCRTKISQRVQIILGFVAPRHGLTCNTVREHIWGERGWVDELAPMSSPAIGLKMLQIKQDMPNIFR